MKNSTTISTAPLAALFSQVPMMRGEIHAAFVRDHLPIVLGEQTAFSAFRAKVNDMEPDDNDPDESMPWDVEPDDMIEMQGAVAVVSVSGKLCTGLSAFEAWCYGLARSEDISAALSLVAMLPARAVVLNINSPGGFRSGCRSLRRRFLTCPATARPRPSRAGKCAPLPTGSARNARPFTQRYPRKLAASAPTAFSTITPRCSPSAASRWT